MSERYAPPSLLQCFAVQCRVIGALMMRELHTRFGREHLGYIWMFIEPMLLGGAVSLIHHLLTHGEPMPGNINSGPFWVTGYTCFYLWRGIINRSTGAIQSNAALLYHRQVTVMDVIWARDILETLSVMVAMSLFLGVFIAFGSIYPYNMTIVYLSLALMGLLSHGIGMMISAAAVRTELVERIVHLVTYLSMPLTGSFFMVFWLPYPIQAYALLIPPVNLFELLRYGLYGDQVPTYFNMGYTIASIALLNLGGMLAVRISRKHIILN